MNHMTVRDLRDMLAGADDNDLVAVTCCQDSSAVHALIAEEATERYTQQDRHMNSPMIPTMILDADQDYRSIK